MKEFNESYIEGLKVSRDGEIERTTTYKTGYQKTCRTFGTHKFQGYLCVYKIHTLYLVHRLVAEVYLNNNQPLSKDYDVHHINGDRTDNRVENLLIITHGEHKALHNTGKPQSEETKKKIGNANRGKTGALNGRSIPVIGIHKITGERVYFPSACEAERVLGIHSNSILDCCGGKRGYKSAGGYVWQYANKTE